MTTQEATAAATPKVRKVTKRDRERLAALRQHIKPLVEAAWPMPTAEQEKTLKDTQAKLLELSKQAIAWAELETATKPDFEEIARLEQDYNRVAGIAGNREILANVEAAVEHILAERRPRVLQHGFRVKLATVTLEDDDSEKTITLDKLWAKVLFSARRGVDILVSGPRRPHVNMIHPHVYSGKPCMGEVQVAWENMLKHGLIADAIDLLEESLGSYNSGSPYIKLPEFIGKTCSICESVTTYSLQAASEITAEQPWPHAEVCSGCAMSCSNCGYRYVYQLGNKVLTADGCPNCMSTCDTCKGMVPRGQFCKHCSPKCEHDGVHKPKIGMWVILMGGDGKYGPFLVCSDAFRKCFHSWKSTYNQCLVFDMAQAPCVDKAGLLKWLGEPESNPLMDWQLKRQEQHAALWREKYGR